MFKINDLYVKYKQDVFCYLMSLTHDYNLSEDLLSETFLKAMISLPAFQGKSSVKTWLCSIARYTWLQHLRSSIKTISYDDLLSIYVRDCAEDHYISKQAVLRLKELLYQKDEKTRQVFVMRVNGISYSLISEQLMISESSARVIEFRTKQWLRSILEEEGYL